MAHVAAGTAPIERWLEAFSSAVRAAAYERGGALFGPDVLGFGTVAERADGLDRLVDEQWRKTWATTRGFRFDLGNARIEIAGDFAWGRFDVVVHGVRRGRGALPAGGTGDPRAAAGRVGLARGAHPLLAPPRRGGRALIHYLVTAGHDRHTMRRFRRWWAGPLRDRIRILPYEALPGREAADPGLYVFSDLERLRPRERAEAAELHARLLAAGPVFRVLNDPSRALRRFDLLCALHERGLNAFRAWRADAPLAGARFPVFVRAANAHEGSFTGLLHRPEEVEPAIRRVLRWRWRFRREDLLVVEFLDTSDPDGTFRKCSAMRIGPALLPRHLLHGEDWVVKKPGRLDAARLREEQEFLDTFPHREQVAAAFGIARIDYGRIDYSVLDGRVQVWEINTNPVLIPHPRRVAGPRLDRNLRFGGQVIEALGALESGLAPGAPLPLPSGGAGTRFGPVRALLSRLRRP